MHAGAEAMSIAEIDDLSHSEGDSCADLSCVYVIDDDAAVLDVLRLSLELAGYRVVCYSSASQFLLEAPVLPPGVVISDQSMPDMQGLDLQRRLAESLPMFRFILISAYPRTSNSVASMQLGAITVLDKPLERRELLEAVSEGFRQLAAATEQGAVLPPLLPDGGSYLERLSRQEQSVIQLVFEGATNKAISIQMGISVKTVEKHRSRAMRKLHVHSLAGLVRLVQRERAQQRVSPPGADPAGH
jgi:FixJ family two-component response regulator